MVQHDRKVQALLPRRVIDEKVKEMKDQVIRARAYLNFALPNSNSHFVKELKLRIKDLERALGDSTKDSDLSKRAFLRSKAMEGPLAKATHLYPDCPAMVKKLRAMAYNAEEQVRAQKNQATFLVQLAGWTTPKGLHCLSMRLTAEYFTLLPEKRNLPSPHDLLDTDSYHFAVFSDNVLACHVVVQSTLSNAKGKVNGAVETCQVDSSSFPRMDTLVNFSDPMVAKKFRAKACTWAFGVNIFDLQKWRRHILTRDYEKYLQLGKKRPLWTASSLPLGWVTFYNQTVALDRRWHVLGLGSHSGVRQADIDQGAVIHYDGVMKPWLDIGFEKYKPYWRKHVNYSHPFLQQCNIHE